MKLLKKINKEEKEPVINVKGLQDIIPDKRIWKDGIFLFGKNKYSKTYRFNDINYAVASRSDKEGMFLNYSELLNSLDAGATTKITIFNRKLNKMDFENNILLPMNNDNIDEYRKEYNNILLDKAEETNGMVQEKFITVSINKRSLEEARNYFTRTYSDLLQHFGGLGSKCYELNADDKLRLVHDFYRIGDENNYNFDILSSIKKGHSFKDYICPDSFDIEKDYFKINNKYGRVLYLKEYANYIKILLLQN